MTTAAEKKHADKYLQTFMHGLERRNPGEPEFHQAVLEIAKDIVRTLENVAAESS